MFKSIEIDFPTFVAIIACTISFVFLLFIGTPYEQLVKTILIVFSTITAILYFIDKEPLLGCLWVFNVLMWIYGSKIFAFFYSLVG